MQKTLINHTTVKKINCFMQKEQLKEWIDYLAPV